MLHEFRLFVDQYNKDLSSIFNICRPSVHYRVSWSAIQSNFHGFTAVLDTFIHRWKDWKLVNLNDWGWVAEISAEGGSRFTVYGFWLHEKLIAQKLCHGPDSFVLSDLHCTADSSPFQVERVGFFWLSENSKLSAELSSVLKKLSTPQLRITHALLPLTVENFVNCKPEQTVDLLPLLGVDHVTFSTPMTSSVVDCLCYLQEASLLPQWSLAPPTPGTPAPLALQVSESSAACRPCK
jgi:hypothetical protein